jgi:hypothetical protein
MILIVILFKHSNISLVFSTAKTWFRYVLTDMANLREAFKQRFPEKVKY